MGSSLALQRSTNWVMKSYKLGADQFVGFVLTSERNETWTEHDVNCGKTFLIVAVVTAIERRSETSRYHGSTISDDNKPTTTATARRTAKNNMFILTNNNFARASRYFVHFFAVAAPKLPNFSSLLNGVHKGEHKTKNCRFLFLNSDNDRYGPNEDLPN